MVGTMTNPTFGDQKVTGPLNHLGMVNLCQNPKRKKTMLEHTRGLIGKRNLYPVSLHWLMDRDSHNGLYCITITTETNPLQKNGQ